MSKRFKWHLKVGFTQLQSAELSEAKMRNNLNSLIAHKFYSWCMVQYKSLNRQPRQQPIRPRRGSSSLYHTPPQLSAVRTTTPSSSVSSFDDDTGAANDQRPVSGLQPRLPPLCVSIRKKLLQDIEENGGLHVFKLSQLRKARPRVYDDNEKLLRQVQNYINFLKKINDANYLLLLSQHQVLAASRVSQFFPSTDSILSPQPDSSPLVLQPSDSHPTSSATTPLTPVRPQYIPTSSPAPVFTSPSSSRYNRNSGHTMSSSNSNALALRPMATNHDECEGMSTKICDIVMHQMVLLKKLVCLHHIHVHQS